MRHRNAFTLVELLVVIGIISLLISILLPSLSRARKAASEIACASQMRQLGIAHTMYCNDNGDKVVPSYSPGTVPGQPAFWFDLWRQYLGRGSYVDVNERSAFRVLICPEDPTQGGLRVYGTAGPVTDFGILPAAPLPSDQPIWSCRSYGLNFEAQNKPLAQIKNPSETMLISEMQWWILNTNYIRPARNAQGVAYGAVPGYGAADVWLQYMPRLWHSNKRVNVLYIDGHVDAVEVDTLYPGKANEKIFFGKPVL